jgi:hypothetical protein
MKKHKVNDSPEFKTKKALAKWCAMTLTPEDIAGYVVYTDGDIELAINDEQLLYKILEAE